MSAVIAADPRRRLRSLLNRPAYWRLWLARTISQVGDVAQFTTLALLLIALTGSGLGVSGAVLAEILPVLLLAPLAGSIVDRLPRVRVMVAADLVRVVLAATLALWHGSPVLAYAVAFGLSAGQVFFSPAAQSLLPTVVDDDDLVVANSGIWTAAVTAQVPVAPAAALLAVDVGFDAAFAVNAVSFALSAVVLRGLPEPERPRPASVSSPFAHAREAFTALGQIPLLKALAAGQFLAALSAGATSALLVVLAHDRLGGGAGYGGAHRLHRRRRRGGPATAASPPREPLPATVRVRGLRGARPRRFRAGRGHRAAAGRGGPGRLRAVDLHRQRHLQQSRTVPRAR
jgi:hypothetical protein